MKDCCSAKSCRWTSQLSLARDYRPRLQFPLPPPRFAASHDRLEVGWEWSPREPMQKAIPPEFEIALPALLPSSFQRSQRSPRALRLEANGWVEDVCSDARSISV